MIVHYYISIIALFYLLSTFSFCNAVIANDYVFTRQTNVPSTQSWSLTSGRFEGDDIPAIEVRMPFSFSYWGIQTSTLYLNPNGIVQLSRGNLCCRTCATPVGICCEFLIYPTFSGSQTCTLANDYFNMFAVCATDFSTSNELSTISWGRDVATIGSPFVILWQNMMLDIDRSLNLTANGLRDPTNVLYTFGVCIYPSGRIDYYYYNVTDPALYAGWDKANRRPWLVGLKQPIGQSEMSAYSNQWADPNNGDLPGNGTYVPRSFVQTSSTITFWPIGSNVCVSPSVSPMAGNITLRIVVQDYSSSTRAFAWQCSFRVKSSQTILMTVAAEYSASNNEIRCMTPAFNRNDTAVELLLIADGILLPTQSYLIQYVNGPSSLINDITQPLNSFTSLSLFCSACSQFRPDLCWTDCAGVLNGQAFRDSCNVCVGGTTGLTAGVTLDCMGICGGPFQIVPLADRSECVCPGQSTNCFSLVRTPSFITTYNNQYVYSLPNQTTYQALSEPNIEIDDDRFMPLAMNPSTPGSSTALRVGLPFLFPYFGTMVSTVLISYWGAVVMTYSNQACMSNLALNALDQSSNCEYNMIAGYLGEYELGPLRYAFLSTSNVFAIRYSGIRLVGAPVNSTEIAFTISLYPSGRVSINYDAFISPLTAETLTGRRVLIGLITPIRPSSEGDAVYPSKFNVAASGRSMGLYSLQVEQQWRSTLMSSGVFIPKASVIREGRYEFYPIAINMCAAPYYGSRVGSQTVYLNLGLTSDYARVLVPSFSCMFGTLRTPVTYNALYESFDCTAPEFPISDVGVSLSLQFNNVPLTTNRVYYYYYNQNAEAVRPSVYQRQYLTAALCNQCYSTQLKVNTAYCYLDCHNSWRGTAVRDDCNACVGGLTGLQPDYSKDCYGTCYGGHTRTTWVVANKTLSQCSCGLTETECKKLPAASPTPSVRLQYVDTVTSVSSVNIRQSISQLLPGATSRELSFASANHLVFVPLPFTLHYFGNPTKSLFISRQGAIYLWNVTTTCVADEFTSINSFTFTLSSSCLYSLIAPANSQFDDSTGSIYVYSSEARVAVHWSGLTERTSRDLFDFGAIVSSDHSVLSLYQSIQDPVISTNNHSAPFIMGLRWGTTTALMQFPMFFVRSSYNGLCGRNTGCTYATVNTSPVSRTELMFLPSAVATTGYYPDRFALFDQVTGDMLFNSISYCPIATTSCISPRWGTPNGGTEVLIIQPSVGCMNSSVCCALSMNVSCNFGSVNTPARYDLELGGWRCRSPVGLEGTFVSVWLEEAGRRIGSVNSLLFEYKRNGSELLPISLTDFELRLCRDCSSALTKYCATDCSGTWRGNATLDDCGQCKPPNATGAVSFVAYVKTMASSSYTSVRDCLGVCYGPFRSFNQTSSGISTFPKNVILPQCGCTTPSPGAVAQRSGFPWSSVCFQHQRKAEGDALSTTVEPLFDYQRFILAIAVLGVTIAIALQLKYTGGRIYRRIKMTPAEREREVRRRERRRVRERERRARRRAIEQGLPLPGELAPGQAVRPAALPLDLLEDDPPIAASPVSPGSGSAMPSASTPAMNPLRLSPRAQDAPTESEQHALAQLASMGFTDEHRCVQLLRRHHGDVNVVLNELLR